MPRALSLQLALLVILALLSGAALADQEPGAFGFAAKADADGFFDPTLKSVTIERVVPGLPAAVAGLAVGDLIIEVEGKAVAGAKAKELEPLFRRNVGEKLNLKLKRSGGEIYVATLVAAQKK